MRSRESHQLSQGDLSFGDTKQIGLTDLTAGHQFPSLRIKPIPRSPNISIVKNYLKRDRLHLSKLQLLYRIVRRVLLTRELVWGQRSRYVQYLSLLRYAA